MCVGFPAGTAASPINYGKAVVDGWMNILLILDKIKKDPVFHEM